MELAQHEIPDVVQASIGGDQQAFGRIVTQYQGMVCATTYSVTGDRGLSEELAQETFVTAWQRLANLRDPSRLPAWLHAIARNLAKSAMRKRVRDPLRKAKPIDEQRDLQAVSEPLQRDDRDTMVWEAIESIPETYREPLVLFYREGQSVKNVADCLNLSEDAVKQRLSRGRRMLKAQVASMVEDVLGDTGPGPTFGVSVVAALPLLGVGVATAETAVVGSVAAKGIAGKGAVVGGAGGAAIIGGLAGGIIGMTGGFFGMWNSIRNAQTLRLRRYALKVSAMTYAFVWLFLGYEGMCGVLLWQRPVWMGVACAIGWVLYLPLLFALIYSSNRKAKQVLDSESNRGADGLPPIEESEFSLSRVWRSLYCFGVVALIGSIGCVLWMHSLPGMNGAWVLPVVLVGHWIYFVLYRNGVRIARDEVAFLETAPRRLIINSNMEQPPISPRARFISNFFMLAGVIFGPAAWLIILALVTGDFLWAAGVIGGCSIAFAVTLRALQRASVRRGPTLFRLMTAMGVFLGAVAAYKAADWMTYLGENAPVYGIGGGLIIFALYFVIGLAILWIPNRSTATEDDVKQDPA